MNGKKLTQIPENAKLTELFNHKKRLDRSIENLSFTELTLLKADLLDIKKKFNKFPQAFTYSTKMIIDEIDACNRNLLRLMKKFVEE